MTWITRWVLVSVIVPFVWKRRDTIIKLAKHMLGPGADEPRDSKQR